MSGLDNYLIRRNEEIKKQILNYVQHCRPVSIEKVCADVGKMGPCQLERSIILTQISLLLNSRQLRVTGLLTLFPDGRLDGILELE